ncbi:uncharacterized protein ColSpa_12341 [Colletotrichum spaethianum]|uniref:Uncharacterized protein n=1 Tax=Colletotrichum spaethianum TaxID=700344 RepID=A0AA37PH01_9PEZI|nr:uncharacterized protein ColSpa_12341 [Colletotrichum spaethianum]GKT52160.1 hypothetical protein ColSpa_12341 [Colletotrichum spaethianum]
MASQEDPEDNRQSQYDNIDGYLPTYEEISARSEVPLHTWKKTVNPRRWGNPVDITQAPSEEEMTTYIAYINMEMLHLRQSKENLTISLYEDFNEWSTFQWEKVYRAFRAEFIRLIELKGVFTFVPYNPKEHDHLRIYKTRMGREVVRLLLVDNHGAGRSAKEATALADVLAKLAARRTRLTSISDVGSLVVAGAAVIIIIIIARVVGRINISTAVGAASAVRLLDALGAGATLKGGNAGALAEARGVSSRAFIATGNGRTTTRLNQDRKEVALAADDAGNKLLDRSVASDADLDIARRHVDDETLLILQSRLTYEDKVRTKVTYIDGQSQQKSAIVGVASRKTKPTTTGRIGMHTDVAEDRTTGGSERHDGLIVRGAIDESLLLELIEEEGEDRR